jgi:hypothetical protein
MRLSGKYTCVLMNSCSFGLEIQWRDDISLPVERGPGRHKKHQDPARVDTRRFSKVGEHGQFTLAAVRFVVQFLMFLELGGCIPFTIEIVTPRSQQ